MQKHQVTPEGVGFGVTAEWVWAYFQDVDSLDPKQVAQHYHSDGTFQFANKPPAKGPAAIEQLLNNFYQQIEAMEHHNTGLWLGNNSAVFAAEVAFTKPSGTQIIIPAISILRRKEYLIDSFLFVMDVSPLSGK